MKRPATLLFAATLGALLAAGIPSAAGAKDLGVRGATWGIAEPDLLEQIETRLLELQRSGALARFETEARERARRRLEEPEPVPGIAPATERRSRLLDPAVTVARDIRTADGALIAAAGTRINPLERTGLARELLFVDGRREAEVAWALAHDRPAKIVLLAGRPLDLMRLHGRPFFFDTGGALAARFHIAATPALVAQDGTRLRITEVPVESLPRTGSGDRDDPGSAGAGPSPRAGRAGIEPIEED